VISGLKRNELLIMCGPTLIAVANWLFVRPHHQQEGEARLKAAAR
jgi:hypothetical protein